MKGVDNIDYKIPYLILKNEAKLEKLIASNAPYDKIVRQSQTLDKYVMIQMKFMNKIETQMDGIEELFSNDTTGDDSEAEEVTKLDKSKVLFVVNNWLSGLDLSDMLSNDDKNIDDSNLSDYVVTFFDLSNPASFYWNYDSTLSEEDNEEKCNDMKSCLDRAVKQLASKKESLNQDNKKPLKENIGNYKIILSPRANSRGEFCVRVYENLKRDVNKSFYTKDYNEALEQFKQISAKLKQALKESFAENIDKYGKRHQFTHAEQVVFENAIDCLIYGYGFKYCNTDVLEDKKRAKEIFEMAIDFLGNYDESLNEGERHFKCCICGKEVDG